VGKRIMPDLKDPAINCNKKAVPLARALVNQTKA